MYVCIKSVAAYLCVIAALCNICGCAALNQAAVTAVYVMGHRRQLAAAEASVCAFVSVPGGCLVPRGLDWHTPASIRAPLVSVLVSAARFRAPKLPLLQVLQRLSGHRTRCRDCRACPSRTRAFVDLVPVPF